MDKAENLHGNQKNYIITIDRNNITEIMHRDEKGDKYLYQYGKYVISIYNII